MSELISIQDAAAQGIERIRKPIWANSAEHVKIDIFDGKHGPWAHIYAPFNKECNGRDPVDIILLTTDTSIKEFVPYTGPLPDSKEYKAEVAKYDGCLENKP